MYFNDKTKYIKFSKLITFAGEQCTNDEIAWIVLYVELLYINLHTN